MLLLSMGVSVDGFISDRDGNFNWSVPSDDLFAFHTERVGELGAFVCGRRLYETMLVWETDPRMRENEADAAFADIWSALPKVVFSRTLTTVEGNARLAQGSLADELTAVLDSTDADVEIGGADLAWQAIELGFVDEFRIFRYPVIVGGGTPLLPPVTDAVRLELAETRTYGGQVIYERYLRVRDDT
ncbi:MULTISPECIES: dihydrofolate reductase family protein [Gordonia]|uniref:dihydrofolate reductase family protein n=1 Tax=Gordonia TaxID=2053 RepID=UPI0033909537